MDQADDTGAPYLPG